MPPRSLFKHEDILAYEDMEFFVQPPFNWALPRCITGGEPVAVLAGLAGQLRSTRDP